MPDRLDDVDLVAVEALTAHQRLDLGSCMCGWGVETGDLGRSHPLHVWRELQREVWRYAREAAADALEWAADRARRELALALASDLTVSAAAVRSGELTIPATDTGEADDA